MVYSIWTTGFQHIVLFLGAVGSVFAIIAGVRASKKARKETITSREEAVVARSKQEDLLKEIAKEFKPNHGSSLIDRVEAIAKALEEHRAMSDKWFKENEEAHVGINHRIDQIFLNGVCSHSHRTAERHRNRDDSQE